nr:EAL domain-containing protein [Acholeplasmatales bacterium]
TKIILVDENIAEEIHKKFLINEKCDLAFTKKNIEVFYQPILSTKTNKFVSAEALVRLKADDGRLIYPGDFITEMERDGRIVLLGKIVFSKVCEFISQNNLEELGLDYIEVNLSAVQATQEDLAKTYIEIMEKYNVNPKYINLEITETAQSARKTMLNNINALKEYGVTFSLDDFGTGNSNLNYIVEMPVKIVKFDKEMVTSYFEDRIASYVMDSTIEMIKGLGHKIVFEGIEEEYQVNKAKEMNVEFIQGYYYSKPIDKKAFLKFIKENNVKDN